MQIEQIGTIKYGELKFIFEISPSVKEFLLKNSIETQNLFPKTQFFYQGILMKLKLNHNQKKEIKIIINSIKSQKEKQEDSIKTHAEKFENFPIHVDDLIYYINFYAQIK